MVAIKRSILTLIAIGFAFESVVSQQQIQPRIVGLEINKHYMGLLSEDNQLSVREDSISLIVESLREKLRIDSSDATENRNTIIKLENNIFRIRARRSTVTDSLNLIEQEWIGKNMGNVEYANTEQQNNSLNSLDVDFIFESDNVKSNLSSVDYDNLVKSEALEQKVHKLRENYIKNYDAMLSLKSSYEHMQSEDEAIVLQQDFDSLRMVNVQLVEQLSDTWGYIYDNKSFAYSILMEMLGFTYVLQRETELMREAQAEISLNQGQGGNEELLRYVVQKSSMLPFEILVAEKLGLNRAADSLGRVAIQFAELDRVVCPAITIEERLFIDYEPIEFVSKMPYTTSNPIPETKIYDKGTIYRVIVGAFSVKQSASIFRNTTPLSYRTNEENRHCYYIGGFATLGEAEQAQEKLKSRGFRSPEIVVWQDGVERNLTRDPITTTLNFRVEILERNVLPEGVNETLMPIAPDGTIAKVGNDKFVITSLSRQSQVDSLVNGLKQLDPTLKLSVEKIELEN
ncbi:MAG: SPOR domain-containing protein [Rikenellaceae bacterium]